MSSEKIRSSLERMYLDVLVTKELLNQRTVTACHTSMMDSKSVGQHVLQVIVLACLRLCAQNLTRCAILH